MALDGGEWWASHPSHFIPGERAHITHWVGGLVGHGAGMDILEKRRISYSCWNSNPRLPNCSQVTILNILPLFLPIYNLFTPSLCFMPFSFNAPCQITPLLNSCSLTFGWLLCSIMVTPYFWKEYHFLFTLTVSAIQQLQHKTRDGVRIMI